MAEATSYPLEKKLDLAASYILSKDDAELRRVGPKLVKAKHVILGENGIAQYKAGEEAIGTLDTIMATDKLYGEKAAKKIATETGYNFKPLLDVMVKDAAALGLSSGMKLHEIYEKVVGNEGTELHRLVAEMAPYNEIIGAAKNCWDVELKGAARKVYDFDTGVKRTKREYMRKVSLPMLATSSLLTGGVVAGIASAATLYMFSYSREAVQRITEAAPKAGQIGKKFAKALNKVETQIGKAGFSVPQLAILWGESAIGVPIPWGPVLGYTTGAQALIVAGNKAGSYWHKLAAFGAMLSLEMLKETAKNADIRCAWKNFWSGVKEKESKMEAEAQLEQGPDKTKRGWSDRQMRHLNMLKFPVGKTKYIDIMKLGIGERLNEKEIIEEAGREFADEFGKRYSPAVCNAILKEYLPNANVSEDELIKARGASRKVLGTTITESSKSARRFGTGEYAFSPSYCEQVAGIRAGVLEKEGYDCETSENGDVKAFQTSGNGRKKLKEEVLIHKEDMLIGTSVKYLEDAVRSGGIVQLPKLVKNGIESWELEDYQVHVSDLLEKEVAMPALYHELTAHVGNKLEAFETLVKLGDALSRQHDDAQILKIPTGKSTPAGLSK